MSSKKDLDSILDRLHECCLDLQQPSILATEVDVYEKLASVCAEYLRYFGYKVSEQYKPKYNVKKLDDLIDLFYAYSDNKHPELINSYRHRARDRKIASALVKSRREATGFGMKTALAECADIIETIFEHEDEFHFTMPLNFGILGQKNCGWITDKAIQIMNRKKLKEKEAKSRVHMSYLDEKYDAEPDGFGDLDEILENLKKN